MKKVFLVMLVLAFCFCCKEQARQQSSVTDQMPIQKIRDGFYEVRYIDTTGTTKLKEEGHASLSLDTVFNVGDHRKVIIDLSDFVPLEMEGDPIAEKQTGSKKLLSITLSKSAAEKMKNFTSKRVMKQVAIVINGEVITMHKVREAITGPGIQITRCDDNACEYLFVKIKGH